MITVDDIVHIISEEAGEDDLLLSGARGRHQRAAPLTVRRRLFWLVVNLGTAILAASVVSLFQGEIGGAVLAVLMPIVAGMGGNAGPDAGCRGSGDCNEPADRIEYAADVRTRTDDRSVERPIARPSHRERVALVFGVIHPTPHGFLLGAVMGAAMIINNLAAGLGGILVPVTLDRFRIDPAVSSAVFVTTITDVTGFFSFLGLAALAGLGR